MKTLPSFIALISILLTSCMSSRKETLLYIGTYSENGSEGIYCYTFDEKNGEFHPRYVTPNQENPSFLAISPNQHFLYAVSEVKESPGIDSGSVTAYQIKASGELEKINQQATKGYHPCHVTVSPDGDFVVAANYTSGSLSFYRVEDNGTLSESFQQIQQAGSGPDSVRQEGPHAHSSLFNFAGDLLISADLGNDRIEFYQFNDSVGQFVPASQDHVAMKPGSGPRHFDFSPDGKFIYVMNELNAAVTVLQKDRDQYKTIETVSALPADYTGARSGADIHVSADGRFVYSSNRGHNSIAVFKRADDGTIQLIQNEPVQGDWPRNFALSPSGNFLLVANQKSNNITLFDVDPETGKISDTGKSLEVPVPVCLKFLKS